MFIVDSFDENKKAEGTWVEFCGAELLIASIRSTKYARALNRLMKPYQKMIANKSLDNETQDNILCAALAEGILLDWKEVYSSDGKELKYSTETAKSALMQNYDLREFVVEFATENENFKKEILEDRAKK